MPKNLIDHDVRAMIARLSAQTARRERNQKRLQRLAWGVLAVAAVSVVISWL